MLQPEANMALRMNTYSLLKVSSDNETTCLPTFPTKNVNIHTNVLYRVKHKS